jgi:signal transduction histidine kinase
VWSVARGVVSGHNGQIRVASELDRGTTVRVELPLFEDGVVCSEEARV